MHRLALRTGLVKAIDRQLHLLKRHLHRPERHLHRLKRHLPYHESNHVLNIAYNSLCGGTCLDDLELRRHDEVYLDALGAQRIPDPTTAGDFCRRFQQKDVEMLMDIINPMRIGVWKQQSRVGVTKQQSRVGVWKQQVPNAASQGADFFREAIIDADGSIAPTTGECKEAMGLSYDGQWGYHPLIVSLSNTGEPLYVVNRPGERPSHEGAAGYLDRAAALCREAGFRKITFRGDTDFSQTAHLDRWHGQGIRFIFGYDAVPSLKQRADELPESAWKPLFFGDLRGAEHRRGAGDECHARGTPPSRQRPENVKDRIVRQKGFENLRLLGEDVAKFERAPQACHRSFRMVVVRKHISHEIGQERLFTDYRYFFYITNDREHILNTIVKTAHGRCDQENLIDQLKHGVHALRMPVADLVSNWAYRVMAALAGSLKAWLALLLPAQGRWKERHTIEKQSVLRMDFRGHCKTKCGPGFQPGDVAQVFNLCRF